MNHLEIPIRRLSPDARLPTSAHGPEEDAGLDLYSVEEVTLPPHGWASVGTGLAIAIPAGHEGQVRPRSGLARKSGIALLNSPGTIDPGYRNEIRVLLINHGQEPYTVRPGDRIAQLVIGAYSAVRWRVEESLAESRRGKGGFGSTGT
ncbi:MAG: dUTP diphosphatase [Bryobacterales bacterium]|nr:dUTP diphosphatase [Bryobacterales bacterium]